MHLGPTKSVMKMNHPRPPLSQVRTTHGCDSHEQSCRAADRGQAQLRPPARSGIDLSHDDPAGWICGRQPRRRPSRHCHRSIDTGQGLPRRPRLVPFVRRGWRSGSEAARIAVDRPYDPVDLDYDDRPKRVSLLLTFEAESRTMIFPPDFTAEQLESNRRRHIVLATLSTSVGLMEMHLSLAAFYQAQAVALATWGRPPERFDLRRVSLVTD